ncbi:MAG: hypothetical protein LBH42_10780 [Treponema sp.]|jgi:outer membrane protein OmpA-like peptidoglycan-associated protein|nr:hypothetical protein [Treponema sp.]
MRKHSFFAVAFGVILVVSGYAQDNTKGEFFFSTGMSFGFLENDPLSPISDFHINMLNVLKASFNWEFPVKASKAHLGLEAGYSSGSRFGGSGEVDFIPINLVAAYVLRLGGLSIGPSLRVGSFSMVAPDWTKTELMVGARLEAEYRYSQIPVSFYVSGGLDTFPLAHQFGTLPVVEAGLRFRRGTWGFTGTRAARREEAVQVPSISKGPVLGEPSEIAQGSTQSSQIELPAVIPQVPESAIQNVIYFQPDTANMIGGSRHILDTAGRQLAANPTLRVLLKAYTAPFGPDDDARFMVAMNRARFCRDYLIQHYGIRSSRILIEAWGSEREPALKIPPWEAFRCVELFFIN